MLRELEEAAAQGDALAQHKLALVYDRGIGSRPQNRVEARRLQGLAAAQGLAQAQFRLAVMHDQGHGGPRDQVEARRLYALAATQGWAQAFQNLATMYYTGEGGRPTQSRRGDCTVSRSRRTIRTRKSASL